MKECDKKKNQKLIKQQQGLNNREITMGKFKKTVRPEYEKVLDTTDYEVLMDNMDSMVSAMMPSVYNNAIELTKLIIENRLRNDEELDDEDIYEIHRKSFANCMPDKIDPKYSDYENDYAEEEDD